MQNFSKISEAYDAKNFRELGHKLVDQLADFLEDDSRKTLPWQEPAAAVNKWQDILDHALSGGADFNDLSEQLLADAHKLHSPRYFGHQVAVPIPTAALGHLISSLINNNATIYEIGPIATAMERVVVQWMASKLGCEQADGFLTSGASLGNLTALLAARNIKAPQAKPAILVSAESHYSILRSAKVLGLSDEQVIKVPCTEAHKIDCLQLSESLEQAHGQGFEVFALVINSCSTATGTYDDIEAAADFCEAHDIWLHVDGAHGMSAALSEQYKYLVQGARRADSVVWDAHKMMMIPSLATVLLFKEPSHSYGAFAADAEYLFEAKLQDEWYNLSVRTLECTKHAMSIRIFLTLAVHGEELFTEIVETCHQNARDFYDLVSEDPDFEVLKEPESNIVCFRYLPERGDEFQRQCRQEIIREGEFYYVQAMVGGKQYQRVCFMNPLTEQKDLEAFMDRLHHCAMIK